MELWIYEPQYYNPGKLDAEKEVSGFYHRDHYNVSHLRCLESCLVFLCGSAASQK